MTSDNEKRTISPRDLWKLKFVGDPQVSPDGKRVAFVVTETDVENNGYRSTIWLADTHRGTVRQFTSPVGAKKPVRDRSPRWSPDGERIAFVSNRDGDNKIFCIEVDGGEAEQMGDYSGSVSGLVWSPDARKLGFSGVVDEDDDEKEEEYPADVYSTRRLRYKFNGKGLLDDEKRNSIWVVDVDTGESKQLTNSEFDDSSPHFSQDGESVLFSSARRPETEMYYVPDLYRISADGETLERLTDGEGPVRAAVPSPHGERIAFLGHDQGDKKTATAGVWLMDEEGGNWSELTRGIDRTVGNRVGVDARFDGGSPRPIWYEDGNRILFTITDGGNSHLFTTDEEGTCEKLTEVPPVITSYAVNTSGPPVVAFVGADWDTPGDLWIIRPGEGPVQITRFNEQLLREEIVLSQPERVTFSGAEGWEIEGWLMKPVDFEEDKEYPLILEIHGGPAGTSGNAFFHEYQLLAANGWGVMYTNPRGSRGYGEKHAEGVIGDWGGNDYHDLIAAVDRACAEDWVDPERLGVTGGSYGGYMTNWIVSQTERFAAAVTFRSISNLYTKYGCSDIGFYGNRKGMEEADLWDSEDFIMSRSPIRYAPQVKTPILIVHSEEDLRCPMEQAEQWYVALKRLGVDCEFVRYSGENHELSRSGLPYNRVDRLNRLIEWFARYLG